MAAAPAGAGPQGPSSGSHGLSQALSRVGTKGTGLGQTQGSPCPGGGGRGPLFRLLLPDAVFVSRFDPESRGKKVQKEGKISYADFVWFLISEEDKKTPTR